MDGLPDIILESPEENYMRRSTLHTTSYTTTGPMYPSGTAVAHLLPDVEMIDAEPDNFDYSEFDFPELLSPEVVTTVVAVVPTARINIPKLTSIDNLFDWMEDLQKYVILAEQKTPATEIAVKII